MAEHAGEQVAQLAVEEVLAALPPGASPALRKAIESGCCTHYTVAEGKCVAGGCGEGQGSARNRGRRERDTERLRRRWR